MSVFKGCFKEHPFLFNNPIGIFCNKTPPSVVFGTRIKRI